MRGAFFRIFFLPDCGFSFVISLKPCVPSRRSHAHASHFIMCSRATLPKLARRPRELCRCSSFAGAVGFRGTSSSWLSVYRGAHHTSLTAAAPFLNCPRQMNKRDVSCEHGGGQKETHTGCTKSKAGRCSESSFV